MERTMTFRELVRKIHPDHNPHITDAGGKMRAAVLYKDKPEELYKLAVRWCLLGDRKPVRKPVIRPPVTPTVRRTVIKPAPRQTRTKEESWDTGKPTPNRTSNRPRYSRPKPVYEWRAFYSAVPRVGDRIVVTTQKYVHTKVVRVTPKRVYFFLDGKRTFASKKNVYVVKRVRVN